MRASARFVHIGWVAFTLAVVVAPVAPQASPLEAPGATSLPDSGSVLRWTDLLREEEQLRFTHGEARRSLAHPFLQFGSEVVSAGDTVLVRNRDYGIDYGRGVVFLLAPPRGDVLLHVRYLHLPGPRRRSFRAAVIEPREVALAATRQAADPGAAAAAAPVGRRETGPAGPPPQLQLAGSNTIGLSFGRNREASVDQSLHVEAAGELGEGLTVRAVLSDDRLPVTADGSTEELADLNKVFIEMQGPVVGGVLGDYAITRRQGDLVDVQRELRGGELRLGFAGQRLAIGAGIAKGELRTATFRGSEGVQGPYDLLAARRLEFSTIVPGTERVYVDGRLQRRGENLDYVVDYDRGELRFTSRRRITADTEIAVDYQVNGAAYRRQAGDARLDGAWRALKVRGLFLAEGDDQDSPLAGPYDPTEIAALAASGDRTVVASGIRAVGVGRGLYRRDAVDTTIVRYDPVQGDLEVDFYDVGTGAGSYEDSLDVLTGRRVFVHRGPSRGSFDIGRQLTPAAWHRLASAEIEAAPTSWTRLAAQLSVSGFDANQFSAQDDDDNVGEAVDLRLEAGPHAIERRGGVGVRLHVGQLSNRFRAPGRPRAPFYYKDWNAESDTLRGLERLGEVALGYGIGGAEPWLRLDGLVGRLDRGAELATDRAEVGLAVGRATDRGADLLVQALDTARPVLGPEGGRSRGFWRAGGRYRLGRLVPELRFEHDEFVRSDIDSTARPSYRYLDVGARLALLETAGTTVGVEARRRDTDARAPATDRAAGAAEWRPERRNDTVGFTVTTRTGGGLVAEVDASRRTNEPRGTAGGDNSRSTLGRAVVGWSPRGHRARVEWRHQISEEAVRTLEQVLVLAADGKGDYDAEGRSVGKDLGAYDRVVRFTADAAAVRALESSLRLELGGATLFSEPDSSAGWLRRNLSFAQILSVKEQTRSDRVAELVLLVPSAFQDANTLFGSFRVRQEWSFLGGPRPDALELFLDWQEGLDGRLVDNPIRDRERAATLRYERTPARGATWGGEAGASRRSRRGRLDGIVIGRPGSGSFEVLELRGVGRAAWRLSPSERIGIDLEAARQEDDLSGTRQILFTATPSATVAPTRNLRLLASLAVQRVLEDKPLGVLTPYFFDPPGTKTSGSFLGSYRLARSLQFNVTYNAVRGTDGRFTYDAKAETRALF